MPYITSVERSGLERGRQEGRQEGRVEGTRETLRRIVRARFQTVPEDLERRIVAADESSLEGLVDRAGVVSTIDDL